MNDYAIKTCTTLLLLLLLNSCIKTLDPYDNSADLEYLAANAQREGVVVTSSGLQYIVKQEGTGDQPPLNSDVLVHFIGKFIDGEEFNNSYEMGDGLPFEVTVSNSYVIRGWTEGLQLMNEGAIYEFAIPAGLAYGDQWNGPIYPGATLVFEIELLEILED